MKRALSVDNVLNAKFKGMDFSGHWREVFGQPERAHSWAIWGQSGSGKTTFNMMLAKYLSGFERVLYNSLEEGLSKSIVNAYQRTGITRENPVSLVSESMKELESRLLRKKSPNIVIIDSLKYTQFRWGDYKRFCQLFENKLLIWILHAQGKEPKGALACDIRYDSFVKIYTEGFRAFATSRYKEGGDSCMDIWREGAAAYYGEA